jgi:hypothetical protein
MRIKKEELDQEKVFAKRKHQKELNRKDRKYDPGKWERLRFALKQKQAKTVDAPAIFSIIRNTDEVINYFDQVRYGQQNHEHMRVNLTDITYTDLATISLLMAHMYDLRVPWGYLTVTLPKSGQPQELFRRVHFHELATKKNSDSAHFLSRHDTAINEKHKLAILKRVSEFYGGKKDTDLNPILTELLSNTNNHAAISLSEKGSVPWLVTMEEDVSGKSIKFCVIDLGVGIYNSLTNKRAKLSRFASAVEMIANFFKGSQNETLAKNIPEGLLSTTKLSYRGQGMKEVYTRANNGPFNTFNIITNKAHIDLLNLGDIKEDTVYNFRGTLYYWTLEYAE